MMLVPLVLLLKLKADITVMPAQRQCCCCVAGILKAETSLFAWGGSGAAPQVIHSVPWHRCNKLCKRSCYSDIGAAVNVRVDARFRDPAIAQCATLYASLAHLMRICNRSILPGVPSRFCCLTSADSAAYELLTIACKVSVDCICLQPNTGSGKKAATACTYCLITCHHCCCSYNSTCRSHDD